MKRIHTIASRPSIWLLFLTFAAITFLQYAELLDHPAFLANLTKNLGLTRYTSERILYLLPIIWGGFLFGWKGGALISFAAMASMLPRDIFASPAPEDALIETAVVCIIGNLSAFSLESLRKEHQRRAELEAAQEELKTQLQIIEQDEKRLAALNETAKIISQSLDLDHVLDSAIACIMNVMGVEIVRIYILDWEKGELALAASFGVTQASTDSLRTMKLGEGFNGRVAETGEPLIVEDVLEDPKLIRAAVRVENIRSQLIVPMRSKGEVIGTLAVAMRRHRQFIPDDVDLLTAIGNQVGVAVENARLYEQERHTAEQLKISERRYRDVFENAHDAIWLHDIEGNIIAANKASERLTHYQPDELHALNEVDLLSPVSISTTRDVEDRLLKQQDDGAVHEVGLIKKDGSEVIVQLASTLLSNDAEATIFQHIARDVTLERRIEENLRHHLQHATRSEEEERQRISRELHDDTIQALVVHCQQIDEVMADFADLPPEVISRLNELHGHASSIMQGVRRLTQDLRPATLDNLGLVPALEWLASSAEECSSLTATVRVSGNKRRLSRDAELALFRISQEGLRNIWKHAQATRAEIELEFLPDSVRLTVKDDGEGFDPPEFVSDLPRQGKLGLAGIQERLRLLGGTFSIQSMPNRGTTLTAEISTQ